MKAWIMLIDPLSTTVFQISSHKREISFSTTIENSLPSRSSSKSEEISDQFAHYIAEEMEIACGCGTYSALIIAGESDDVKKICKCLSPVTKSNIIGITPKGYNPTLWREVLTQSVSMSV